MRNTLCGLYGYYSSNVWSESVGGLKKSNYLVGLVG